ncbi:MAG TPA: DUF1592 domain-containing protein [Terriglobia bacterium]|jgi:mono/diheme cytochrome c family protein
MLLIAILLAAAQSAAAQTAPRAMLDTYCITCHSDKLKTAGLSLESIDVSKPSANPEVWEKVIGKLRAASMPPPGRPRPDAAAYHAMAVWLENEIDRDWLAHPNPGRIGAVHRLNRTEYNNAIRDLLKLDVDVKSQLPGDETADGSFDNFADSLTISTAHMERYLSVARQVTRLATGLPPTLPTVDRFEIKLHVLQDDRQDEDLPLGSRGGMAIHYNFPVDGEYSIKVRLQRQYQDYIKGMGWPQQLDLRLDGRLLKRFTVGGEAKGRAAAASYEGDGEPGFAGDDSWEKYMQIGGDAGLDVRIPVGAGPHVVGVSFVREMWEPEGLTQPIQRGRVITNDAVYMDFANVGAVQIGGPYNPAGIAKDTPSRRAIFVCRPKSPSEETACATKILSKMARLAYRRPVKPADVSTLLDFFNSGRREAQARQGAASSRDAQARQGAASSRDAQGKDGGSFDAGIQFALERLLADPDFLLRIYRDTRQSENIYKLSDLEVASRLSFFLWSSIPDERLLDLAEKNQLTNPDTLEKEARRMLADPRATDSLVNNFASQWLNLRRVEESVVDPEKYPSYDLSLIQGFQRETELFVGSTIKDDRSVLELLNANYTFVNERLARHYGIPGVYGTRFRRVTLPDLNQRGGLLGQGSLLVTTSYPDRTSPVLRGKFLLNNIFGLPIPPPPPGVDTNLTENKAGAAPKSIRERLAQHRTSPTCNNCHSAIDPLGFALENYDVIGGWRTIDEAGKPVDATGTTPGGKSIQGLPGLRALLLEDPEQFPRTVTDKLMAYALGRRVEYYDRPSIRKIVHDAAAQNYKWSAVIIGIVKSPAFLMREKEPQKGQI